MLQTLKERIVSALFGQREEMVTIPLPGYAPVQGFDWNPLKAHRNKPCLCDSGKKVKQCCGEFPTLPKDVANQLKLAMKYEGWL